MSSEHPPPPDPAPTPVAGDEMCHGVAVYAAVLGGVPGPGALAPERVVYRSRPLVLPDPEHKRLGRLPPAVRERRWLLAEIAGEFPVTFLYAGA